MVAILRVLSGDEPCHVHPVLGFEVFNIHKLLKGIGENSPLQELGFRVRPLETYAVRLLEVDQICQDGIGFNIT